MKNVTKQMEKARLASNRENAKQAGFYDGRFRPRTHKQKKLEQSRNFCRGAFRSND